MTNGSGGVVWAADYLPFGQADVTVDTVENNLRFAGQYYDQETGLHYNYHRYYDPTLGRYLRADPIGLEGGINLYAYVENNPVNAIDPLGLHGLFLFGKNPWYINIPRMLRGIPRHSRHGKTRGKPKETPCEPKYEPRRAPTPEEQGVPPKDAYWQQDPMQQAPLKPKPKYNPNNPPKKIRIIIVPPGKEIA
jgi:RHS repeat-associated protein